MQSPAISQPGTSPLGGRGAGKVLKFPGMDLGPGVRFNPEENALEIEDDDGGVLISWNPQFDQDQDGDSKHGDNLAEVLSESILDDIAREVMEGIDADEKSRSQWISQREKGMDLLGIKVEGPRSDSSSSSAPLEGMSSVRAATLSEPCLRFQANARGELLPSDGPVKVKNSGQPTTELDDQAQQLEDDLTADMPSNDQ